MSRKGMACQGKAWKGKERECMASQGIAKKVMVRPRQCMENHGKERQGMVFQGKAMHGKT
jgi:hypothetical protein